MKVVNPLRDVPEIEGYTPIPVDQRRSTQDGINRSEYLAILRMLIQRATWIDKWRARKACNHWLNVAKREILIG